MSLPAQDPRRPDPSRFLPFPQALNETPPEARIPEVFGLAPLLFGLGLIGFGATLMGLQWYRSLSGMRDLPLI